MKLTAFILLALTLHVSARTYSQQTVTLHEKKTTLSQVFREINRQTGYTFILNQQWAADAGTVAVDVTKATIQETLDKCLKGLPYTYTIVGKTVILSQKADDPKKSTDAPASSPPKDIHGKVVNEKGEPVEGAYVQIKGTSIGTSTDAKGLFSFSGVSVEEPMLYISFVGFEAQTVKPSSDGETLVKMKIAVKELQDVAISYSTGYQTIPRDRATGSFDLIDNKTYNRGISTDVLSRLDGLANSLYFNKASGGTNDIYVRGTSSILLSSQPLIILDNFPYTGDYNNINPNDIETVTVLKDAAAASQWGARAGNGVIVLTTKKGKYNQRFQLSLNANTSVQDKPNLSLDRNRMTSSDFIDVEKFLFNQGFYDADFTSYDHRVISPVVQILQNQRNGLITADQANKQIDAYRSLDNRSQMEKYLYSKQINQQYSLSMSGGNQVLNYFLSAGYDRNGNSGNTPGNNFEKQTVHSFAGFKPVPGLDVQVGIDYARGATNNSFIGFSSAGGGKGQYYPYAMLADGNGNALTLPRDYDQAFKDTAGGGKLLNWNYRPLEERNRGNYSNVSNDLLFNVAIKYQIVKSLSASVQYQHEWNTTLNKNINSVESYYARNLINQFTQRTGVANSFAYPIPVGGVINLTSLGLSRDNVRPMVSFNQIFGSKHEVTAIAGFEVNQARSTGTSNPTGYGYNDQNLTTINVDYTSGYSFFDDIGYGSVPGSLGFSENLNRYVSYFSNVGYTYDKKYTITASARKDESNLYGVNTNNRGVPLWSTGASWRLSDERFYKFKLIPNLTLRATYGYQGNSSPTISALSVISYWSNAYYTQLPYATVVNPANPELRWEKIGQLNIGVDFGFKNNIVSGSLEYYTKKGVDLLSQVPVDLTTGYLTLTKNAANMITHGVDLALNFKVGNEKGFTWFSTLNANYVKNKITKYLLKQTSAANYISGGSSIIPLEGHDPYMVMTYRFAGLDGQTGDPLGYINKQTSKDYAKITTPASTDDLVENGTGRPPVFGNIINTFQWKGFSLSANISGKFSFWMIKSTIMYYGLYNSWAQNKEFSNRWKAPGDENRTTVPSMTYPIDSKRDAFYQYSDANVIKGDVVKLQDVKLNYDFKPIKLGSYMIKQLSFYLYATNLGIIWRANKDKIDPDNPNGVPVPRMFALGLRSTF